VSSGELAPARDRSAEAHTGQAGNVAAYDVDGAGNPVASSRRSFVTSLPGAEGATIDATTGDLLLATFGGGNHIIVVRGLAPL
jgi:hypothetical protein